MEIAVDPHAQSILADTKGTIVDFYEHRRKEDREKDIERYSKRGWDTLEVGKWTVFHINREEFNASIE